MDLYLRQRKVSAAKPQRLQSVGARHAVPLPVEIDRPTARALLQRFFQYTDGVVCIRRTIERKVRHSSPAERCGRYSTQIDTCGREGISHFCAESSPIRSFHAHRMQAFARAETRLLGSGFLLRALDRREEHYPCAGLIRRAASNDEFDIAACTLDRR